MLLAAAREAIVTTCLELYRAGLAVGPAGNVVEAPRDRAGSLTGREDGRLRPAGAPRWPMTSAGSPTVLVQN